MAFLAVVIFSIAAGVITPLNQAPVEDVSARMQRFSRSLGVACAHCHVDGQWTDESKPAFATARNMSTMVAALNERLGGPPKVSCWTCHRGSVRPSRQPAPPLDAELAKWPGELADASHGRKITMVVYNVALGVGCDHCHVADWTSAEKPQMKMAATMNSLFEIFPAYMPEGARTQCYICHKGSTRPPFNGAPRTPRSPGDAGGPQATRRRL